MKKLITGAFCALLTVSTLALAQSRHPGKIDFATLAGFDETNVTVDIQIGGWLLSWAQAAAEGDEDLEVLSKVESVRVKVFEVSQRRDYQAQANRVVRDLMGEGWERFAKVIEPDSWVHVLVKGSEDMLEGITVIAMDDEAEAVLVNIAGQLDPEDVAALLDDEDLVNVDLDLDWDA